MPFKELPCDRRRPGRHTRPWWTSSTGAGGDRAPRGSATPRGCTVVDGLEILVRQGALSFEAWTGLPAPVDDRCADAVRQRKLKSL